MCRRHLMQRVGSNTSGEIRSPMVLPTPSQWPNLLAAVSRQSVLSILGFLWRICGRFTGNGFLTGDDRHANITTHPAKAAKGRLNQPGSSLCVVAINTSISRCDRTLPQRGGFSVPARINHCCGDFANPPHNVYAQLLNGSLQRV